MAEKSYPLFPISTDVDNNNQSRAHIDADVVIVETGQTESSHNSTSNVGPAPRLQPARPILNSDTEKNQISENFPESSNLEPSEHSSSCDATTLQQPINSRDVHTMNIFAIDVAINSSKIENSGRNIRNTLVSRCPQQPQVSPSGEGSEGCEERSASNHGSLNPKPSSCRISHHDLRSIINSQSWDNTADNIIDEFTNSGLNEPDFKVHPQMRKIDNFYGGEYEKFQMQELTSKKSIFRLRTKILQNQLRTERGFLAPDSSQEEDKISYDDLLKSLPLEKPLKVGEKQKVTAITASAGSGKTTLIRRMVRDTMKNSELTEEKSFSSSSKSHFDMVHYIELKNIKYNECITPAKFLFGGRFNTEGKVNEAYEQLLKNQSTSIFFFDGLDQAQWNITDKNCEVIRPYGTADTPTIMYNLLSHNILPRVKIVISSREFKISTLPKKSKPEEIIALTGFQFEDAKHLFIALLKSDGKNAWMKIKRCSRRLFNLMSTPIFLILAAIVSARYPKKPAPETITELYTRVIDCLNQTDNIQEREKIFVVIQKLAAVAHEGMIEGRVIFCEKDLEKRGLTLCDVRDLIVMVPGNSILTHHLVKGQCILFFCHQSLQEYLSARYVAKMDLRRFQRFCQKNFCKMRWSVVCAFTCGIVHSMELCESQEVRNLEQKKQFLQDSLKSRFMSSKGNQLINQLAAIYETNDTQLVGTHFRDIDLSGQPINQDGADLLSSVISGMKRINFIGLAECGIDDHLLEIMGENMKDSGLQIGKLNLMMKFTKFTKFTNSGLASLTEHIKIDTIMVNIDENSDLDVSEIFALTSVSTVTNTVTVVQRKNDSMAKVKHKYVTGTFLLKDKTFAVETAENAHIIDVILDIEKFLRPLQTRMECELKLKQFVTWNTWKNLQNSRIENKVCTYHKSEVIKFYISPYKIY